MGIHFLLIGNGLLRDPKRPKPQVYLWGHQYTGEDTRQKFYDYMHESTDMFVVLWTPRVVDWKPFLEAYPDFAEKFIYYEMPYAVSNLLHMHDHLATSPNSERFTLGLTDSRRTKLIILKGGKCEN